MSVSPFIGKAGCKENCTLCGKDLSINDIAIEYINYGAIGLDRLVLCTPCAFSFFESFIQDYANIIKTHAFHLLPSTHVSRAEAIKDALNTVIGVYDINIDLRS